MNDKIRKKLLDYEAEPPAEAWNAIVARLDDHAPLTLQQRLHQYEETPPAAVWEDIASRLDKDPIVIPFYQRFASPIQYGAVAILMVIVVSVALLYNHQKTLPKAAVQNVIHIPPAAPSKENIRSNKTETIANEREDRYALWVNRQGKTIKVSKKLTGWMDCLYGPAAAPCNETLHQWHAKMAAASVAPATDFMGTLDMLNTLNKKQ